jgi:hypothetical protein
MFPQEEAMKQFESQNIAKKLLVPRLLNSLGSKLFHIKEC